MASLKLFIIAFLLLMVLARTQLAQCNTLKANISCLDCQSNYDFSGNMIVVNCKNVKNLSVAITEANGSFKTTLPSDMASDDSEAAPSNCIAKLTGGPHQLYASRKGMSSTVIKRTNSNFFTLANALTFSTCKHNTKCLSIKNFVADSKTIDLPLPPEWGFPPTSYYFPVLPIIGIP
ncbi:uncharacterized protein LOC111802294 [Cucurbita pepo subsp. pepo]|uniref:uncharacterized protein LOC111802294 n=1 Tax=Cucurbita pepo subsp. pepo TaxID=3664 RepID=UPI000C9D9AA1|nr:uncharacterized protein LOC111802294 [Cucurbita pepo subsp. pepo]